MIATILALFFPGSLAIAKENSQRNYSPQSHISNPAYSNYGYYNYGYGYNSGYDYGYYPNIAPLQTCPPACPEAPHNFPPSGPALRSSWYW